MGSMICPLILYAVVMITAMSLFGASYESINVGEFGILQNKFSKKFDQEIYYSGRYYTGLAKKFIKFPKKYQTIRFGGDKKDSGLISSTTNQGSKISMSCIVQYIIRPENAHKLYLKWPVIERLKNDMILTVNQAVTSLINQYSPDDFRLKRPEINAKMGYTIGNIFKKDFFSELNLFTISEVILEPKDLAGLLQNELTNKNSIKQNITNQVNQVISTIEQVKASSKTEISEINKETLKNETEVKEQAIAAADQAYQTDVQSSYESIATKVKEFSFTAPSSITADNAVMSVMYYFGLMTQRKKGILSLELDD